MRKIVTTLAVAALVLTACGEKTKTETKEELKESAKGLEDGKADGALQYNDGLVGIQTNISLVFLEYYKTDDADEMMAITQRAKEECVKSIDVLNNLETYEGGERMKTALIDWTETCLDMMGKIERMNDFSEDREYTDEEIEEYELLEASMSEDSPLMMKIGELEEEFGAAQQAFGRLHGFSIAEENPYDDEFEEAERAMAEEEEMEEVLEEIE